MDFLINRGFFFILLFFIVVHCYIFSEDLDLLSFVENEKAELLWNPLSETGIIIKSDSEVVFKLGIPWILFDYSKKYRVDGIKRDQGTIVFPEDALITIHDYFLWKEKKKKIPRVAVILIDPGHGGKDPGAYYVYNLNTNTSDHTTNSESGDKDKTKKTKVTIYEKDLTLKVSLFLYELLKEKYSDKEIILTRSTDEYLKLEERVEIANSIKTGAYEAIVYISIHFNASFNKNAKGFEVWYLPPDYRRNLIDDEEIPEEEKDIVPILNTLLEEEYTLESITLANAINNGLKDEIGKITEERGLKEESWFVVRNAKMPSVLLELGFISNRDEAVQLQQDSYLKQLASGVYNGICTFVNQFESTKGFTE